jgi:hypothetical protein
VSLLDFVAERLDEFLAILGPGDGSRRAFAGEVDLNDEGIVGAIVEMKDTGFGFHVERLRCRHFSPVL